MAALRRRPRRGGALPGGIPEERFPERAAARRAQQGPRAREADRTASRPRIPPPVAGGARDPLHRCLRACRASRHPVQGGAERSRGARQELRRHRRLSFRQRSPGEDRAGGASGRSRPLTQFSLNEFELIRRYFDRPPKRSLLGVGDDGALLRPDAGLDLAVTTDMLVEGRHFLSGAEPRALGHKALAVNLSDLAAMGATPRWATLALALPAIEPAWLEAFSAGVFALAARYNVDLVGGDTTRGALHTISITAIGEVPPGLALERAGARPGDDVWVS